MKHKPPYTRAEKMEDRSIRDLLKLPFDRPWSKYLLGRIEARLDFVHGETVTLNATDVRSKYREGLTRFYQRAEKAGPNTLYRIRVRRKV